jgi:hypothetical protein
LCQAERPKPAPYRHGDACAAWGWAINGLFSVIGSVLTTILSMSFGFRAVQLATLAVYAVAVPAFPALRRRWIAPPRRTMPRPCWRMMYRTLVLTPASVSGSHT